MREGKEFIGREVKAMAVELAEHADKAGLSSLSVSTIVEENGEPYITVRALDADGNSETWTVMHSGL